ncbi:MAG TPA: FixH family protein [Dehalococcoidia bacterium]|nr:FixH family protein [Dehalococcoidia bacterium]
MRLITILVAALLLLAACQSSGPAKKLGDLNLTLSPQTLGPGENDVRLQITDAAGEPVTDAAVTLEIVHKTMDMGKNVVACTHESDGRYKGTVKVDMLGNWAVFAEVSRQGRSLGRSQFDVQVSSSLNVIHPH